MKINFSPLVIGFAKDRFCRQVGRKINLSSLVIGCCKDRFYR
jgi:hypothetical protein